MNSRDECNRDLILPFLKRDIERPIAKVEPAIRMIASLLSEDNRWLKCAAHRGCGRCGDLAIRMDIEDCLILSSMR
jgi:hypothetical protein